MEKNTTMREMTGWMGRLAFILNGLKAWLILLLPICAFVYFYADHLENISATDPYAEASAIFLAGLVIIAIAYYVLIFPSIVKRLRDIVGKDLKRPKLMAFIIIIGLNIPIVGFITGLVLIAYPGLYSQAEARGEEVS